MPQLHFLPCFAYISGNKHGPETPCRRAAGKKCHQCTEAGCECVDMPAVYHDRLAALQVLQKRYGSCSRFLKNWSRKEFEKEIKPLVDDARAWVAAENSRIAAERKEEEERRKQAEEEERRQLLEAEQAASRAVAVTPEPKDSSSAIVAALNGIKAELVKLREDANAALKCFQEQKAADREAMEEYTSGLKNAMEESILAALRDQSMPTDTPKKNPSKTTTPKATPMSTPKSTPNNGNKAIDNDTDEEEPENKRRKAEAENSGNQQEGEEDNEGDVANEAQLVN
ncbi:hypothetical protein KEM55_006170 [Ascosphaera atra]|nr:hypothetical protein KEM55_006170 [Ascosphaera atra]